MKSRLVVLAVFVVGCSSAQDSPPLTPRSTVQPSVPAQSSLPPAPKSPPASTNLGASSSPTSGTRPSPPEAGGPPSFVLFAGGFSALTFVANAGDGSGDLYAVEQVGRVVKVSAGQSAPTGPWLDISARVKSGGEQGLLGLAFHPDFTSNGRLFVDYTDPEGNSVISELTGTSDGTVDPATERVLLHVDQPFPNHNGGMLAFGPDGYLYVGFGDGGSGGDPQGSGQKLTTDLGKILRIDVDSGDPYGIPADNPFQPGNDKGALPEIWDWGVRNPWRFSFDRESGGLFIGDVGQGATEEIDVERAGLGGRNYGWSIMEGDHCYAIATCDQTGLTLPVATYSHDAGCSVTGGYVYRGALFPELNGRYFYSDYCSGTVWTFDADAALAGVPVAPEVFASLGFSVSSFGEDEAGELYVVDLAGAIYALEVPA